MAEQTTTRRPDVDEDWQDVAALFEIRSDTTYLNHGSFGISPAPVRNARNEFTRQLDLQPMDFFVRQMEPLLSEAISKTARFLNTEPDNLVFAENATSAMNIVADSFPLQEGDEVLTNNHEYGAVHRIWNRACERVNATNRVVTMPQRFESSDQIVDAIFQTATEQTRLVVVSHITSPTALIMPVHEICERARAMGIAVCIDGPHAPAHVPLDFSELKCDFYTASCHKWLCASLGSGFLYVSPEHHARIQPTMQSWGRLLPAIPEKWYEEFIWPGTRDPATYLSVPVAIEFMESIGLGPFRERTRHMQRSTTDRLIELTGQQPIGTDRDLWYGTMSHVPLPEGYWSELQASLWNQHGIEVPIICFEDRWFIRVSHHLYTTQADISRLIDALKKHF